MDAHAGRRFGWIIGSVAALLLGDPTSALASCAVPPPLGEAVGRADVAFVGLVVETSNRQRNAIVEVEEVWKGDVAERVEVRGGPQGRNVISTVDRAFKDGVRYLFLPYHGKGGLLRDNACTSTQPFKAGFEDLRPATVETPDAAPSPDVPPSPSPTGGVLGIDEARDVAEPPSRTRWIVPGVIALILAAGLVLWLRTRRGEEGPRA